MSRIFADNAHSIGNTPLVQINRIAPRGVTILAKIEGRNPGYSVKCRIGANMIWDAESSGRLKPGMTIVEPTSGNTGIGLAFVAAARGYKLMLTMPASMSIERRKVLKALGAELVLTEPAKGMKGAIEKATEIVASDVGKYFMPAQFDNPANPAIHEKTTGPEIWNDTDGAVDVLVAGVGTGGTITGVSRYIKNTAGKPILSVAVEPVSSPVITQALAGEEIAEPAQDPGHRRRICAEKPRFVDGRPGRAGHRRRIESHGPAPDAGRRDFVRDILRCSHGGRGAPGRNPGDARQDHRGDSAGLGRALSVEHVVQ